jgi:hypothetical protein
LVDSLSAFTGNFLQFCTGNDYFATPSHIKLFALLDSFNYILKTFYIHKYSTFKDSIFSALPALWDAVAIPSGLK